MGDLLKNLALDDWFKVCIYLGVILFIASLFAQPTWVTNEQLGLAGLGFFFIGLGEWKNLKVRVWREAPNVYTGPGGIFQATVREPDAVGMLFLLLGCAFLVLLVRTFF